MAYFANFSRLVVSFFKYMDNKLFDKIIFIMLIILTTMVTITGYYGGTLVETSSGYLVLSASL